jgi:hypothetical protein
MSCSSGPDLVVDGLKLYLDAANPKSYNGGTIWKDLSGNNNDCVLTNGPTFNPLNAGTIVFDGVDDFVNIQKTPAELGFYDASYTMEAWVYPTDLASDKTMFGTDVGTPREGLHLVFRSATIHQGHYASDFSVGTVSINNWYQIVYTYNKANNVCQIFKNGVLQGEGSILSFIGTSSVLIGRWQGTYYFKGNGSIYKIYNRVLSSIEILQNYRNLKSRFRLT